jgi:hypothetical protein
MCIKCVRRNKRLGTKGITYGQIKAIANNCMSAPIAIRGLFGNRNDVAVEAHIYKIQQALTKRRYNRKNKGESDV